MSQEKTPPHGSEAVSLQGDDVTLEALLFTPPAVVQRNEGVVILHGWGGNAYQKDIVFAARRVAERGYTALAVTMRGFGGSGGKDDCGLRQPLDVRNVVEWLAKHPTVSDGPIFLMGSSQGGQVALLSAAHKARVKGVIAVKPVTDIPRWANTTNHSGIPDYIRFVCNNGTNRSPVEFSSEIKVPVLFIHGGADKRVPTDQSLILAELLDDLHRDVTTIIVDGETHKMSFRHGDYWPKIFAFFERVAAQ